MSHSVNVNLSSLPLNLAEIFLEIKDGANAFEQALPDVESHAQIMRVALVRRRISEFQVGIRSLENQQEGTPFIREIEQIQTTIDTCTKEDLSCPVCYKDWLQVKVTALKCGHLICKICKENPSLLTCPFCQGVKEEMGGEDEKKIDFLNQSLLKRDCFRRLYENCSPQKIYLLSEQLTSLEAELKNQQNTLGQRLDVLNGLNERLVQRVQDEQNKAVIVAMGIFIYFGLLMLNAYKEYFIDKGDL